MPMLHSQFEQAASTPSSPKWTRHGALTGLAACPPCKACMAAHRPGHSSALRPGGEGIEVALLLCDRGFSKGAG